MSGCTASSGPAPSSTTTSSCSQRKPGGLEHSLALAQERDRGAWPDCFDELWAGLTERYGRSEAARQMVDVLLLCREHGPAGSSSRSVARSPPARSTAARSRCSPAAPEHGAGRAAHR